MKSQNTKKNDFIITHDPIYIKTNVRLRNLKQLKKNM
ncbi:hypothetical protein MHK_001378 [Candidatus Magnetomorum sp. HK-1]|nr:hypothetical protein MHK_007619 [Candidatus Magnetomorum sp. HK-1]KPA18418.1 hypothetical protein MHK_001378 [Candidatus Magnetomorum sp. HK-1]